MNRKQKIFRLAKIAAEGDPHWDLQKKIFDALVSNGLSEPMAAIVVSNVGWEDLNGLWKKIKQNMDDAK